jgi:hypothetical protein
VVVRIERQFDALPKQVLVSGPSTTTTLRLGPPDSIVETVAVEAVNEREMALRQARVRRAADPSHLEFLAYVQTQVESGAPDEGFDEDGLRRRFQRR